MENKSSALGAREQVEMPQEKMMETWAGKPRVGIRTPGDTSDGGAFH